MSVIERVDASCAIAWCARRRPGRHRIEIDRALQVEAERAFARRMRSSDSSRRAWLMRPLVTAAFNH
jgi:hypothetical protein